MTTPILVLIYAAAAAAVLGIFAGIPMWMVRRHPDTAPVNELPEYLRANWKHLHVRELAGAGQRPDR